jgi:predicted nucleic acid-binding protein
MQEMNGIDFLADTNFIINMNQGVSITKQFEDYKISISFITEIELISAYTISNQQRDIYREIVDFLFVYNLNEEIKTKAITIRNQYKLKIPDAIIASTALVYDLPLLTFDKDFEKVKGLNLILLQKD